MIRHDLLMPRAKRFDLVGLDYSAQFRIFSSNIFLRRDERRLCKMKKSDETNVKLKIKNQYLFKDRYKHWSSILMLQFYTFFF